METQRAAKWLMTCVDFFALAAFQSFYKFFYMLDTSLVDQAKLKMALFFQHLQKAQHEKR
jgi:hypothetical protein